MKNNKTIIILLSVFFLVFFLFIFQRAFSAYPAYIQLDTITSKPIDVTITRYFHGSKNISKKTDSYSSCINQSNRTVSCLSFCPSFDTEGKYCPPESANIYSEKQEGKKYRDILVTNHSYYFDYALARFFGFTQYKTSEVSASSTSRFKAPRVIAFMDDRNVASSKNNKMCNGAIKIEKALLGFAKTISDSGKITVHKKMPAIYFYISRYVYPIDKEETCISFGIPMDIVEPVISDKIKKYLPTDFDIDKINYYFLDISSFPK